MRLTTFWIVRNPGPHSGLVDIVWEQDPGRLGDYIAGSGPGTWEREHHTIFTAKDEAVADAIRRMVMLGDEEDEGYLNDVAYTLFGYGKPEES